MESIQDISSDIACGSSASKVVRSWLNSVAQVESAERISLHEDLWRHSFTNFGVVVGRLY
jgi:hypothetical protein